jgi:RimJ/RimL family protein N-acetyltransferase
VIVRAAPREHYPWLWSRIEGHPSASFRAIEAITPEGQILAMVGYDGWTETMAEVSVAVDDPKAFMSRGFLRAAFSYPFNEADKEILIARVRSDNARSLRLQRGLGFREVHRIRDGFGRGVDFVVMELRRHECRWIAPDRKAA